MTEETQAIELSDVQKLAEVEAPDLITIIQAIVDQGEPTITDPPDDMIYLAALRGSLQVASRSGDKKKRQTEAQDAWKRYLTQPAHLIAPQVRLAELIVALYDKRTGPARQALMLLAREGAFVYGIWGGLKRVYKRAEADMDAELFGALSARFDVEANGYARHDTNKGTLIYLQRRGWRFLRQLGKGVPELYPQFCVEVLRSYPAGTSYASIAGKVERHHAKKWGAPKDLAKTKKFRAPYRETWEKSADPLMLLLETCQADIAASFAIAGLRELFPEVLRKVTPEWLGRLAYRPLSSAHDFLVETLEASPEFHQGKLKGIGLHEAVQKLLISPSQKARKYAIEYARGHASDLSIDRLVALMSEASDYSDTIKFVSSLITARNARELGVQMLGRLVGFDATQKFATKALNEDFDRKELGESFLTDMLFAEESERYDWASEYLDKKYKQGELSMSFWMKILDDPRVENDSNDVSTYAFDHLEKFKVGDAPGDWILEAIARDDIGYNVGKWLESAESLPKGLDLERIRGLVFDPQRRSVAFKLLGNRKLVSPGEVGLGWLLALARRADPQLHEWAHRYLLQHMRPEHFAEGKEDVEAGVKRLFALAMGKKEPEAVRAFAQTYLRCHHPKIGKEQPESKQFNIKSGIARDEYSEERVWPALWDQRADVRRFGVTITRTELRKWKAQSKVYELAESSAKEVRKIAYDALSQAGEEHADPELALKPEELDAAQIFSMTESRTRSSRDVAIELIRKHYKRIGGAERLGWLMQSADREVRFFAVRLLWEKHRPRGLPSHWKPSKGKIEDAGAFKDAEALRALLRRLLFTIPPGRSMEQLEQARSRKLPTSIAKRSLIEIVRDLAVADVAFANVVAPLLGEFTGSIAKGEWQMCLSALMTLRSVHGISVEGLA